MTDKRKLVEAALSGDAEASERIVREYTRLVFGGCLKITGDRFAAEDLTQDVFLYALSHLDRLRDPEKISEWLYGTARRMSFSYLRREREYFDLDDWGDRIRGDGDLSEMLVRGERIVSVREAVADLSDKNRAAVEMFYFYGMSVADIASTLGVSEGTVKSRLHEARKKLKGELVNMSEKEKKEFDHNALIEDILDEIERSPERATKEKAIKRIDVEGIPFADRDGQGGLLLWRGKLNLELRRVEDAKKDFMSCLELCNEDNSYRGVAASALKSIEFVKKYSDIGKYAPNIGALGEKYKNNGTRLEFTEQPGFGGVKLDWRQEPCINYFASSGELFFDTSLKEGESFTTDEGVTVTAVSYSETVSVPAGIYENCLHVHIVDGSTENDVWYCKGVGMVKACIDYFNSTVQEYLLSEAEINGGDGYFPFAVGNRWRYSSPEFDTDLVYLFENEIIWTDGTEAVTAVTHVYVPPRNAAANGEQLIGECELQCKDNNVDEAIDILKRALRLNDGILTTTAALGGLKYLSLFKDEVLKNNWRVCPSSFSMGRFIKSEGKIVFCEEMCSFGPYRFGTRTEENRIFGAKPWRYLLLYTNSVWNDNWVTGYSEERMLWGEYSYKLTVADGGTVTTPAGAFDNCVLVTISCEKNGKSGDYYFESGMYPWFGTKKYYFACGAGLVRFDSVWGGMTATSELVEYDVPAGGEEYLPVHIGSRWVWDEKYLTAEGYRARCTCEIASGVDGKYLAPMTQQFWYKGTEKEYEEFKKNL